MFVDSAPAADENMARKLELEKPYVDPITKRWVCPGPTEPVNPNKPVNPEENFPDQESGMDEENESWNNYTSNLDSSAVRVNAFFHFISPDFW